ncbi:MAG: phosphatase PAP2 family protein [Candidatus Rokuibacteriota bacterium]
MIVPLAWVGRRVRPLLGEKLAITAVLTLFFAVCWFLVPRHLLVAPRMLPLTALDRGWPFVEGWVYVYLSIGLFNIAAPYLTTARPLLHRHAWGFAAITVVSFACFVFFPVEMPAPTDHASTVLYGLVLADTRLNNFPSLHASYTVYGLLYWAEVLPAIPWRRARRLTAAAATVWAAALILSVLFLKQHYLADLAAGGALGALVYWLGFRRTPAARWASVASLAPRREIDT